MWMDGQSVFLIKKKKEKRKKKEREREIILDFGILKIKLICRFMKLAS